MKTKYAVLTLTFALTACAAPEAPQAPPAPFGVAPVPAVPGTPAWPVEFAQAAAHSIQMAQSHNKNDVFSSRGRGGRTLIIQTSQADPKAYADLEEDLSVMYRILTKSRNQEDSGLKLENMFSSSSSSVRSMYLEGYGAVFMLNVRFPLVAPQGVEEEPKAKDTASEEWRKAKEELYARNTFELDFDKVWGRLSGPAEEYDAQKVENLTTSVLEGLKHATNIRNLKSDEFVTVAVLGAEARVQRVSVENDDDDGKVRRKARVEALASGLGESTMTIRVKKSDIDDFAKGRLDLDAFKRKAKMLVYVRPADAAGKMSVYPSPTPKPPTRR
jgi:hypothetical protein